MRVKFLAQGHNASLWLDSNSWLTDYDSELHVLPIYCKKMKVYGKINKWTTIWALKDLLSLNFNGIAITFTAHMIDHTVLTIGLLLIPILITFLRYACQNCQIYLCNLYT